MSTGGPDLFVICKNCQSEVSPYITECPYCGSRLRKRAPKLDREGRPTERKRRTPTPSLPRLRRGEIPGIRGESRPYATIALVLAGLAGTLLWRAALVGSTHAIELWAQFGTHLWWRLLVAPFTYTNTGYAIVTLGTIAIFGWLLERRHGPWAPLLVFVLAGGGGMLVAAHVNHGQVAVGGNGAALGLLAAWAMRDVLGRRRGREDDSDLLGVLAIAAVLVLLPLATDDASGLAGVTGGVVGIVLGLIYAKLPER
jgi:membrane associated rhomboid family serine protease